jgi:hypothetical protein
MRLLLPLAPLVVLFITGSALEVAGHDPSVNPVTWNREISRIFFARCASCHHAGGAAFSMMTYPEAQPHATEIKESVLARRMPPWGAVKGFGEFRNDQGLTQQEMELIANWVDGGMKKGNNPNVLPKEPKFGQPSPFKKPKDGILVSGELTLERPIILDGLIPQKAPKGASLEIVADLPDGGIQPLVWLYEYNDSYRHPFLFAKVLQLPAGTVIRGVPADAEIVLIPGKKKR